MAKTLKELIISVIATAKSPLVNSEIRQVVQRVRPGTSAATIDTVLSQLSPAEGLVRLPSTGSVSKYQYDVARSVALAHRPVATLVLETIKNAKSTIDRKSVLEKVRAIRKDTSESSVDMALMQMSKAKTITRSKNPMSDSNANNQAKYVYAA